MESITYTAFRAKLADMMDKVNEDRIPLLVTRQNGSNAVLLSLDDFKSYEETAYLMSSRKNAEQMEKSLDELRDAV